MPPALENKGLTAYNKFIAFDGRIISLDFPSFRCWFDSHYPLRVISPRKQVNPFRLKNTSKNLHFLFIAKSTPICGGTLSNKLVIFQLSIKRIKRCGKAQNNAADYAGFPQLQVISYKAAQITAYPHKDHEVYPYPAEYGECL